MRRILNEQCRQVSAEQRELAGKLLAENISGLEEFSRAKKILLFSSLPSEIPLSYLIRRSRKKQIFFPQPSWRRQKILAKDMDLIIVPARGYDIRGNRLGRGGGFYDRLLKSIDHKKCLGVAYSFQVRPKIPCDHHDQPVSKIVTEKEIITIKKEEQL